MNCKKTIILVSILIFISVLLIYSTDDEIKFPGKFNLEYISRFDSDIMGAKPFESTDSQCSGDLYLRNELKGTISIVPVNFYSLNFWLKDRFEIRYYDAVSSSNTNLLLRNRFFAGMDNIFSIPKVMDIGTNFELRINNNLNSNGGGIDVRVSPALYLAGKYDFGLSFKMSTLFEFYFYPAQYKDVNTDKNRLFQFFQIEMEYLNIAYEFFHFFAPKDVKCSLTYEMYLLATIYSGFQYEVQAKGIRNKMDYMRHYIGFNFNFWGIQPFIGFYALITQSVGSSSSINNDNRTGLNTFFRPGLKTGLIFQKDWFELGITYTGVVLVYATIPQEQQIVNISGNTRLNEEVDPAHYRWENHISSYIKFKL